MFSPVSSLVTTIPSQMISYKDKIKSNKKWGKECVDSFENLGRRQYVDNLKFQENYQMLNGKFIWHHYFEDEGYHDMLTLLTKEFEVPSTLRHYDIISKVVNNLTEKLSEFPDIFRVEEQFEEDENNEYVRTQTRLMHESIKASINAEIKSELVRQGVDPDRQDFASEEEAMQYYEEMQQLQSAMTPPQIQKYMKTEWQSQGEIWGMHQISVDRQRYRLTELERKEFRDMLVSDRCFRHFFLTGDGYMQETWNPLNTFYHTSPDVDWVEDGDFVGRIVYMTKSDIIERYGWKMKSKDVKALEDIDSEWESGKNDLSGFPYKVYAPFEDYKAYTQIVQNTGYDPLNKIPVMNDDKLLALTSRMPFIDRGAGLYRVTEVYWKSQKKIGKAVYIDEETGQLVKELVDENFAVPEGWKEKRGDYLTGDEVDTVYWTWVNELWQGTKIAYSIADVDAIYLDLEPCEFQFKGDFSPFGAKLPVCGRSFNNRNAQSMSLVDLMKPHQVGYNLVMNQLYQLCERETGVFAVWDAAFFNTMKDWGGEDSWDKIALVARELGHVFGDTSPRNMQGANPGNQLPKQIDLTLTAQMMSRAKLAEFFEARAMAQLGVSPQMMSDVKATETLGGIQTAVTQAQLNVQRYYSDFFEYKQRCLTMSLDIAQYVQSNNKDITIMYTKSDASREFIRLNGTELLLRNMHVYIVNSQELMRQLEIIRNLFVNNNTTNASALDLVEIITSNSPAAIKAKLEEVMIKQEQREGQMMEQQDKAIQQQGEIAKLKEDRLDARNTENNVTKKEVAYIQTFNKQPDNLRDTIGTEGPDLLEYDKLTTQKQNNNDKAAVQKESNSIKRQKIASDTATKNRELELKEQQLKQREKETKAKIRVAKVNKN
jgi:hypothetical protein